MAAQQQHDADMNATLTVSARGSGPRARGDAAAARGERRNRRARDHCAMSPARRCRCSRSRVFSLDHSEEGRGGETRPRGCEAQRALPDWTVTRTGFVTGEQSSSMERATWEGLLDRTGSGGTTQTPSLVDSFWINV
ncbi:hypothetical protein EYF80_053244 [Liparis tanakae]|uniref:Uncharacterized protein n=1 Tax=Liparis tanakae TaxID=230148 RepID=A0A4Z2F5Z1_9TELE|nr:hypothetical protein EYF80_053244 [Liparis tanakae]